MTTITLEVPDELARQLRPMQQYLPELLALAVNLFPQQSRQTSSTDDIQDPAQEILDFLVSKPTPEQILGFKCSSSAQACLEELLEKNQQGLLNEEEEGLLDVYQQITHFFILLKAHARTQLVTNN
jgi:hypothetical protein